MNGSWVTRERDFFLQYELFVVLVINNLTINLYRKQSKSEREEEKVIALYEIHTQKLPVN